MPTSARLFSQYPNPVLIETGCFIGDGIQAALDAGFPRVISIELSPKYYQHCCTRFSKEPRVEMLFGDSEDVLPLVLDRLTVPATFWLDGHYSCGDTAYGKHCSPLIQELEAIDRHPIRTHSILIDDMRCWRKPDPRLGFGEEDILRKLHKINPNYCIRYHDEGFCPGDVLAGAMPDLSGTTQS